MKVMFMISARANGVGGHFHSLRSVIDALSSHIDCVAVNVGRAKSPVLHGITGVERQILYGRLGEYGAWRSLCKVTEHERPDIIHSFDVPSLFFARLLARRYRKPLVHSKCGGPNPSGWYPLVDDLVLFSVENYDYFSSNARFKNTRLHLIPNRVHEVAQDKEKIARIRPEAQHTILRISRISPAYESVSEQTLRLVEHLRRDGVDVAYLHVGVTNCESTEQRLRKRLGPADRLVQDPLYTTKASEVIEAGDLVVGTGRGFMEAASRGRILLAPLTGANYPVLVTPENWRHLFRTNFSPRGHIPGHDEEANYKAIRRAVEDSHYADRLKAFSREIFEEHFSIENAIEKYLRVYREVQPCRLHLLDTVSHTLRALRNSVKGK